MVVDHAIRDECVPAPDEIEQLGARVVAPLMPNHLSLAHKILYKAKKGGRNRVEY